VGGLDLGKQHDEAIDPVPLKNCGWTLLALAGQPGETLVH
jgi:hypothetical protein